MEFKNATRMQLQILRAALSESARNNEAAATQLESKSAPDTREYFAELAHDMRVDAQIAETMREDVAHEMHMRGMTSCQLAHPAHKTCVMRDRLNLSNE